MVDADTDAADDSGRSSFEAADAADNDRTDYKRPLDDSRADIGLDTECSLASLSNAQKSKELIKLAFFDIEVALFFFENFKMNAFN